MSANHIGPNTTYFEVLIDNELKRFTASRCLTGRSEILTFCLSNGIPVQDENHIITYHIRENEDARLLQAAGHTVLTDQNT